MNDYPDPIYLFIEEFERRPYSFQRETGDAAKFAWKRDGPAVEAVQARGFGNELAVCKADGLVEFRRLVVATLGTPRPQPDRVYWTEKGRGALAAWRMRKSGEETADPRTVNWDEYRDGGKPSGQFLTPEVIQENYGCAKEVQNDEEAKNRRLPTKELGGRSAVGADYVYRWADVKRVNEEKDKRREQREDRRSG
jgi:hypothetical protein